MFSQGLCALYNSDQSYGNFVCSHDIMSSWQTIYCHDKNAFKLFILNYAEICIYSFLGLTNLQLLSNHTPLTFVYISVSTSPHLTILHFSQRNVSSLPLPLLLHHPVVVIWGQGHTIKGRNPVPNPD